MKRNVSSGWHLHSKFAYSIFLCLFVVPPLKMLTSHSRNVANETNKVQSSHFPRISFAVIPSYSNKTSKNGNHIHERPLSRTFFQKIRNSRMLRPSAFQNNGNSGGIDRNSNSGTESSSSKLILRPSSFQLAAANSAQTTNKSDDEPSTTSATTTASDEAAASSTSSQPSAVAVAGAEVDGEISSTTNNNTR